MTSHVAPDAPGRALVGALVDAGLAPESDPRRIAEYSYDASNYRVVPAALVQLSAVLGPAELTAPELTAPESPVVTGVPA